MLLFGLQIGQLNGIAFAAGKAVGQDNMDNFHRLFALSAAAQTLAAHVILIAIFAKARLAGRFDKRIGCCSGICILHCCI